MFNEKLTKQLSSALSENGFQEPTPIQSKVLPKINGGLDLLVVGPTASGKSSSILIGVIQKLKNAFEDAPRALIIVPDEAKAIDMMGNFKKLSCYTDLRAEMVVESGKINKQTEAIYFGTDIIIGTAKRIMEIYLKKNLNITKIKLLAFDDAETLVKQNVQGHLERLSLSLPKCQHLVLTSELNSKVEKLADKFLISPLLIEF